MYEIQSRRVGRAWTTRASFDNEGRAIHYLNSLATFGRYRKRLLLDGKVIFSQLKTEPWGV